MSKVIIKKSHGGTGIEIWAGFRPVQQLLGPVFSCFHGQKKKKLQCPQQKVA